MRSCHRKAQMETFVNIYPFTRQRTQRLALSHKIWSCLTYAILLILSYHLEIFPCSGIMKNLLQVEPTALPSANHSHLKTKLNLCLYIHIILNYKNCILVKKITYGVFLWWCGIIYLLVLLKWSMNRAPLTWWVFTPELWILHTKEMDGLTAYTSTLKRHW